MPSRKTIILTIFLFALVSLFAKSSEVVHAASNCPGLDRPCADGYYNSVGLTNTITGVVTDMTSAIPQVRDTNGYSGMRVGVVDGNVTTSTCGFAEIGWVIYPARYGSGLRHVYASYLADCSSDAIMVDSPIILPVNEYSAHNYRVTAQQSDPTFWKFKYEGMTWSKKFHLGFGKVPNVTCGGEVSSASNAIGVADCGNVEYSNNDWSAWVPLPSFQKRVADGYHVDSLGTNSWRSYGNN